MDEETVRRIVREEVRALLAKANERRKKRLSAENASTDGGKEQEETEHRPMEPHRH